MNNSTFLELGKKVEDQFLVNETKSYSLHLETNQFAVLELEQKGIDVTLAVEDAATGKRLLEINNFDGIFGRERFFAENKESFPRDLRIKVFPTEKERANGKFTLTLKEIKPNDKRSSFQIATQNAVFEGFKAFSVHERSSAQKAFPFYQQALIPAQESGDKALEALILFLIQRTANELNDREKGYLYGEMALNAVAGQNDPYLLALVEHNLGYTLVMKGELSRGVELLNKALTSQRQFGDLKAQVPILVFLSFSYQATGDTAKLEEYAGKAYHTAKEVGDIENQILSLVLLSGAHYNNAEFTKAIEVLELALPLTKESAIDSVVNVFNELARNNDSLGQEQKALDYYLQGLATHRRISTNKFNEGILLNNIATIYRKLGQNDRALLYNSQSIEILTPLNYKSAAITALISAGVTNIAATNYVKARELFNQAFKIAEDAKLRLQIGLILANFGRIDAAQKNHQKAIENFRKSADIFNELKMKRLEAISLNLVAESSIELRQFSSAEDAVKRALDISHNVGDPISESNSLFYLARVRRSQQNLTSALELIESSLRLVESFRQNLLNQESRTIYFSTVREKYDFYVTLLTELSNQSGQQKQNYREKAYAVSEKSRARNLLDLLAESYTDISGGIKPELAQREQNIRATISALQTQLIQLRSAEKLNPERIAVLQKRLELADDQRALLQAEIRRDNPRYANFRYPQTLSLNETQAMLDGQTILLEYHTGGENSYLFAVGKNEFEIFTLPDEQTLRSSVKSLRQSLTMPTRTGLSNLLLKGNDLYKVLVSPAEKLLKNKSKIIVSADGVLNYLPFEVLLRTDSSSFKGYQNLPYLVRDFEISYTPSASVLANFKNSPEPTVQTLKSFLAFAAPDYSAHSNSHNTFAEVKRSVYGEESSKWLLADLKNAKTEAERIAALFPSGQATIFTGSQATEERVKTSQLLNQYRYLHFAVHGLIDEEKPQFSSLILSLPEPKEQNSENDSAKFVEDGLLQTPEIFNLHLRADLVTLSACETGLGQELRGEGIVGLTRAFFYAGTPSVLVSLWKVDDASTAELMTGFYENLRNTNQPSKAAALRQAQLKMLSANRYAHPYYWAGFVLQGRSESNKSKNLK